MRDFRATRRAQITPQQLGPPAFGGQRGLAGLLREELALLAGVSVHDLTRLERGNLPGDSDSVLGSLTRALQLDDAERAHLFDLADVGCAKPRGSAIVPAIVIHRQEVRPMNAVSAVGAPLQFTIARLR